MADKVFVSWSGDKTYAVAEALAEAVQDVLGTDVFLSKRDLRKGSFGLTELVSELMGCSMGVLVLTRENINSNWMHFEAGALIRAFSDGTPQGRVCPFLFDIEKSDLSDPFRQLQYTENLESEVLDMFRSLDSYRQEGAALDAETLQRRFKIHFREFNEKVKPYFPTSPAPLTRDDSSALGSLDAQCLRPIESTLQELKVQIYELKSQMLPSNTLDWIRFQGEVRKLRLTAYAALKNAFGYLAQDGQLHVLFPVEYSEAIAFVQEPENSKAIASAARVVYGEGTKVLVEKHIGIHKK